MPHEDEVRAWLRTLRALVDLDDSAALQEVDLTGLSVLELVEDIDDEGGFDDEYAALVRAVEELEAQARTALDTPGLRALEERSRAVDGRALVWLDSNRALRDVAQATSRPDRTRSQTTLLERWHAVEDLLARARALATALDRAAQGQALLDGLARQAAAVVPGARARARTGTSFGELVSDHDALVALVDEAARVGRRSGVSIQDFVGQVREVVIAVSARLEVLADDELARLEGAARAAQSTLLARIPTASEADLLTLLRPLEALRPQAKELLDRTGRNAAAVEAAVTTCRSALISRRAQLQAGQAFAAAVDALTDLFDTIVSACDLTGTPVRWEQSDLQGWIADHPSSGASARAVVARCDRLLADLHRAGALPAITKGLPGAVVHSDVLARHRRARPLLSAVASLQAASDEARALGVPPHTLLLQPQHPSSSEPPRVEGDVTRLFSAQPRVFGLLQTFEASVGSHAARCAFLADYWTGKSKAFLVAEYVLETATRPLPLPTGLRRRFPTGPDDDDALVADRAASAQARREYGEQVKRLLERKRAAARAALQRKHGDDYDPTIHTVDHIQLDPEERPEPPVFDKWEALERAVVEHVNRALLPRFATWVEGLGGE